MLMEIQIVCSQRGHKVEYILNFIHILGYEMYYPVRYY